MSGIERLTRETRDTNFWDILFFLETRCLLGLERWLSQLRAMTLFYRDPRFDSQYLPSGSQLSVTLVPQGSYFLFWLLGAPGIM